jgi:hypothetical protein
LSGVIALPAALLFVAEEPGVTRLLQALRVDLRLRETQIDRALFWRVAIVAAVEGVVAAGLSCIRGPCTRSCRKSVPVSP